MEKLNYLVSVQNSRIITTKTKTNPIAKSIKTPIFKGNNTESLNLNLLANYNKHIAVRRNTISFNGGYPFFAKELPGLHCAYTGVKLYSRDETAKLTLKLLNSKGAELKKLLLPLSKDLEISKFVPENKNIEKRVVDCLIEHSEHYPDSFGSSLIQKMVKKHENPLDDNMLNIISKIRKSMCHSSFSQSTQNDVDKVLNPIETKLKSKDKFLFDSLEEIYASSVLGRKEGKLFRQILQVAAQNPKDHQSILTLASRLDRPIKDKIGTIIQHEKNGKLLKRKNIIESLMNVERNISNSTEREHFRSVTKLAESIPQSTTLPEAFIVKYGHRSSTDIIQMIINPLRSSAEHIQPHSEGGPDFAKNFLNVAQVFNGDRGVTDFAQVLKENPVYAVNINKSLNEVYQQTKQTEGEFNQLLKENPVYHEHLKDAINEKFQFVNPPKEEEFLKLALDYRNTQVINYLNDVTQTLGNQTKGMVDNPLKIKIVDDAMPENYKKELAGLIT